MDTIAVHEHLNLVYAMARHMGRRRHDFEDLLAEGMLGLVEAGHSYDHRHEVPFVGFARIRVRGRMLDYIRNKSRHLGRFTEFDEEVEHTDEVSDQPDQQAENQEILDRVMNALCALDPETRELVLAVMQGETVARKAREMGIPRGKASKRKVAACAWLREVASG